MPLGGYAYRSHRCFPQAGSLFELELDGTVVRKRTVTTIEMHQTVTIRRSVGATLAWCRACLTKVEMVSLEEAALLAGFSLRDICVRAGTDHLHLLETSDGALVCLSSLLNVASLGDGGLNSNGADALSLPTEPLAPGDAKENN